MKMTKLLLPVCLLLLFLCACGEPSPVSEAQLREDIEAYIAERDPQTGGREYSVEAFEVTKRQTSTENGVDKAYIKTVIKANDDSMKTQIELVTNYEMYNDGWHWENAEILEEAVIPLIEPAYSEEDLSQCLQSSGNYPALTDVVIYDKTVDMEQGYATYSLACQDVHINMVKVLDVTVSASFINEGYSAGKWVFNEDVLINSTSEDWNLAGEYFCDFSWSRNDYEFYASGEENTPLQYHLFRRDHNESTAGWEQYSAGTLDWFSLSPYTKDSFLIKVIDPSDYMRRYYSSGYSVKYEGMDFGAMKYAAFTCDGNKKFAVVFIGSDSAYITANVADVNESEMEIVVKCVPIHILQMQSLVEESTPRE